MKGNVRVIAGGACAVETMSSTAVLCNGGSDGTASVDSVSGFSGTLSYNWSGPSCTCPDASGITGLMAGTYNVTVSDSACQAVSTVDVTELLAITLGEGTVLESAPGANDGSATVTPTGGAGAYTYMWDAAAGSQTTATASGLGTGTYCVTVTDGSGCMDSTCIFVDVVGILEATDGGSIKMYPNPAFDRLYFDLSEVDVETIHVYTVTGKKMHVAVVQGQENAYLDMHNLPAGHYVCNFRAADGTSVSKKFLKK